MIETPVERVERRIRIEDDGTVVALSGKVEFGQGLRTAFAQLVAEELDVPIAAVRVVLGDTALVPHDAGTVGSRSVAVDGLALRRAAARARALLVARAAARLGVAAATLATRDGAVVAPDGRTLGYPALLAEGGGLAGEVPADVPLKPVPAHGIVGHSQIRLDAHDIVTGRARYTADVRLPGLLFGQVLHPPVRGSVLRALDDSRARAMPGVVAVVRDGDLVGVVAEREAQARNAVEALDADWAVPLPVERADVDIVMRDDPGVDEALAAAERVVEASYALPHISNAPIGPSAAVADVRDGAATVYAGTQRPFGLRAEVALALGLPEEAVRVIPQLPSGTYGRNSLGDAALEAARLSKAAGRPVLVQWTREEEFAIGPARPAASLQVSAALDADGRVGGWRYDETTSAHGFRGSTHLDPRTAPGSSGRNAIPPYAFAKAKVTLHIVPTPVRTASFRSLAAAENVFAIESFMDELAARAQVDPLAFRLRHVEDARLRHALEAVAARAGWGGALAAGRGRGLACTLYHGTYVAQVAEVSVAANGLVRLERFWCAVDPGLVVNPDGVRNQVEGGIQQSASWTLLEELRHREGRITTTGWDAYPIATFRDAPREIVVDVIGDPTQPSTGVGEPGMVPVAAAIANAVFAACGARVREVPISAKRVRAALGR